MSKFSQQAVSTDRNTLLPNQPEGRGGSGPALRDSSRFLRREAKGRCGFLVANFELPVHLRGTFFIMSL